MSEFEMTAHEQAIWDAHMRGRSIPQIAEDLKTSEERVHDLIVAKWAHERAQKAR